MIKRLRSYKAGKLQQELYDVMFDYRLKEITEKIGTFPKEVQIKFVSHIQETKPEDIQEQLKHWHRIICWG